MKKYIVIIVSALLLFVPLTWVCSIVKCEISTYYHKEEFKEGYKETMMLEGVDYFKVLSYSNLSARIYYVERGKQGEDKFINIIRFVKKDDKWVFDEWEDSYWGMEPRSLKIMWPYIFESMRRTVATVLFGIIYLCIVIVLSFVLFKNKTLCK